MVPPPFDLEYLLQSDLAGVVETIEDLETEGLVADLGAALMLTLLTTRSLVVRIDPEVFELATLAQAHAKCETNRSDGRIVVRRLQHRTLR